MSGLKNTVSDEQFLHSAEYQVQVLNYMLHSAEFLNMAKDALQAEMFSDKCLQWYFDTLSKAPIKLSRSSLKEELLKAANNRRIKKDEIPKYIEIYKSLEHPPLSEDQEHIRNNVSRFIRMQSVKKAIIESFDLAKEEKWDEVTNIITKAVNSGVDVLSLGHNYFKDYESRLLDRLHYESGKPLTTGIPELDDVMHGGIKPGQVGLIVGALGRGKSLFLSWLARAAIVTGEQAVYYSYELPAVEIATRFDSLFCQIKPQELRDKHLEAKEKLELISKQFGSSLIIKEYLPKQASVATIEAHYKQLLNNGIRPSVVLVDYLDLIKPSRYYGDNLVEMDETVQYLCGLAKSNSTRVWTATQLNRSGIVSENPDESSIAGSITKLFNCDVAVFMAQTKEENELEEMRLIVTKNRNGKKGISIGINTNFNVMKFFDSALKQEPKEVDVPSNTDQIPPENQE